jgi:hypothetical protein
MCLPVPNNDLVVQPLHMRVHVPNNDLVVQPLHMCVPVQNNDLVVQPHMSWSIFSSVIWGDR